MFVKALFGSRKYYAWLTLLAGVIGVGTLCYIYQFIEGLHITGLSRDVTWGFYIAQLTFFVGVAASAVMVVLPYYLHNYKAFGKITILGEFLAVGACAVCMISVFVDMGQPLRVMNVLLYPTPNSVMFWDFMVLSVYAILNLIIGLTMLDSERKEVPPPFWVKPLIYISIPWAVSIHTVTAFLYAGLPGRHLWLTAIMAARFLASAFASGPSLLVIMVLIIRKVSKFDPGKEPIQKLAQIITYAMLLNVFFLGLEFFTAFYSQIPDHMHSLKYLFVGLEGHSKLVPWMWFSVLLAAIALFLLIVPYTRHREGILAFAVLCVFGSTWIDKGMGLVVGGFIPNPLEHVTEYSPTIPEMLITFGTWAIGLFIVTVLYKIAIEVREELAD